MKKYLFPALALGLVMTSCQSDEPFAPGEGGEKQVTFTLTAPTSMTRAGEQSSSNLGGLSNKATDDQLHYTLALYYGNEVEYKKSISSKEASVEFNPTVILGRNYRVVAYADFVGEKTDLTSIAITNGINNEKKDAYFANPANVVFTENDLAEQVTLTRPFGKLRLVATDYSDKTAIKDVSVKYRNGGHLNSFNAFSGEFAETTDATATYDAVYNVEYTEATGEKTIFVDYIPVNGNGVFPFEITVTYTNGTESFTRTFAEDIPVKRNALTTLKGNFFTAEAKISVVVDDNFDDSKAENRTLVSSASQLQEVINNATPGETTEIILGGDIHLTESIVFGASPSVNPAPAQTRSEEATAGNYVLDLNGKTIIGTMNKSVGAVIKVDNASLKVIGGTISSTANNGGSAIENNGKLVIEGTVLNGAPNANGSWPAYTVNNTGEMNANGVIITSYHGAVASYGEGAVVILNDCEIDMKGISGFTSHGIYTYNNGKVIVNGGTYTNKATDQASTGASVINGAVEVNAGTFTGRIENYYGTPVLKGGSYTVKPNANFIATGYKALINQQGDKYYVVPTTEAEVVVTTADELVAALEANKGVYLLNDIKIEPASMSNAYGTTGINVKNGQTIDGGGHTLNIKGAGGTWDSGINTTGGIICNITVTGSFRGIFINHNSDHSEKVVLKNVTIGGNGTVYTISCDQGLYQGIEATNCTFNGWTSFAKTAGEAKFVNCSFGEGSGYKYCRPYSNTEFVNCTFCPGYEVDTTRATVTFTDCTFEE